CSKLLSLLCFAGAACIAALTAISFIFLPLFKSAAMSLVCESCRKTISPDGRHMSCSLCEHDYHLGKTCSGIADSTFATMSTEKKEKWRCKLCRFKSNHSDLEGAADVIPEAISQSDSTLLATQIMAINQKLDSLVLLETSVDTLLELPGQVEELLLLKPCIDQIKTSFEQVRSSITSLEKKYDSLLTTVSAHTTDITDLRTEVGALKATVSEQADTILSLRSVMNEAEQFSRRQKMEIHGVKVAPGEAPASIVAELADKLGIVEHQPTDVVLVHRLSGKRALNPPILVKFTSVEVKDRWVQARGKLRLLSTDDSPERVFFNDNLTQTNRELFWLARTRGKELGYKFVWVKNARIFARKRKGAPHVRILQQSDLNLIV
ncbi:unnamed protein product, partial [Ixodes hexagonus]